MQHCIYTYIHCLEGDITSAQIGYATTLLSCTKEPKGLETPQQPNRGGPTGLG